MSSECVLCGDTVILPAVCIQTGRTADLVRQSTILKWRPRWLGRLWLLLLLLLLVLFLTGPLMDVPQLGWMPLMAAIAMLVSTALFWWLSVPGTRRLDVTWYVAQKVEQKRLRQSRRWRIGAAVMGAALVFLLLVAAWVSSDFLIFAIWPTVFIITFLQWARHRIHPEFSGRHEGLNILTGLSSLFLQQVQAMIDRHQNEG